MPSEILTLILLVLVEDSLTLADGISSVTKFCIVASPMTVTNTIKPNRKILPVFTPYLLSWYRYPQVLFDILKPHL